MMMITTMMEKIQNLSHFITPKTFDFFYVVKEFPLFIIKLKSVCSVATTSVGY